MNRQPALDGLDLYRRLDESAERTAVNDDERIDAVTSQIGTALKTALSDPAIVRGWRAQALFASTVVALDGCELMTQVDLGEVFVDGDSAKAPDFFLHLRNGRRILVDVKGIRDAPQTPEHPEKFGASEVTRLRRFGDLYGAEVFLAFYYSYLPMWTLVSLDDLSAGPGGGYRITFAEAMMRNKMALIGDRTIGVGQPLEMTVYPDASKSNTIAEDGQAQFTVGSFELRVAGTPVTSPLEARIVVFLMAYGEWPGSEVPSVAGGAVQSLTWGAKPDERANPKESFEIIGTLSSMYARAFEYGTTGPAGVTGLQIDPDPGMLVSLIPHDYDSEELPLWRFELVPDSPKE